MRHGIALFTLIIAAAPSAAIPVFDEAFTGFSGAGFAPAPAPGALDSTTWRVTGLSDGDGAFGGTHTGGDFARGESSGSVTTGGVYAFEVGESDRALGLQATGSDATPGAIELRIPAAIPRALERVAIAYELHYRADGGRATAVEVSVGNGSQPSVAVAALGAETPEGAVGGRGWTVLALAASLPAALFVAGDDLLVRWRFDDAGGAGARDEIAIDDVTVAAFAAPVAVPEPRGLAAAASAALMVLAWRRRRHARVTSV